MSQGLQAGTSGCSPADAAVRDWSLGSIEMNAHPSSVPSYGLHSARQISLLGSSKLRTHQLLF